MPDQRRIIHVDMDAFFAAIEMRDFPQYRGKPLIVGGSPTGRGVVSTCSYEARKFGIHSAMPSFLAYKLCPRAIFVPGRYEVYGEVGRQIREIFLEITPVVEAVSIDEAYLDVSEQVNDFAAAIALAREIKDMIRQRCQLTGSAGISYNKFLAKIASDMDKPDGLTLITPDMALPLLEKLEIEKFHGIGKATAEKMHGLGIRTGRDLKKFELNELMKHFGSTGKYYYEIVRGIDRRRVTISRIRKSLGKERTFSRDLYNLEEMIKVLTSLAADVSEELITKNIKGKTITLKIKYNDFTQHTRSFTRPIFICDARTLTETVIKLLEINYNRNRGVRLLGISVSNLNTEQKPEDNEQQVLDFFSSHDPEA